MSNIQYSIISLISQHLFRPSDLNHFITENLFPFVSPSLFLPTPQFGSVQFSHSVMSDSVTPWTAARQASLSFTIPRSLLRLVSMESVMPSNHLILCCPLLLTPSIFPSIRVFPNESILHIRWPKYWSFSFSTSPSNEHSGLISFRIDKFDFLDHSSFDSSIIPVYQEFIFF